MVYGCIPIIHSYTEYTLGLWMWIHRIHQYQWTSLAHTNIRCVLSLATSFLKNMWLERRWPQGQRDPFEIMCFHCIKKNEEYGITFGILFSLLVQYSWNTSISIKSVDITSSVLPNGFSHGTSSSRFFSAKSTNKKNLSKGQNARSIEKVKQACS